MPRIPSRQTYLAGIGLAWIVAAAVVTLWDRYPGWRRTVALAASLVLAINIGYLWTRKRAQYRERSRPTQALIEFARNTSGAVRIERFPYPPAVALGAWVVGAGRRPEELQWEVSGGPSRGLQDYRFAAIPGRASVDPLPAMR
jgi:hypothetical protein